MILSNEILNLEKELAEMQDYHLYAWNQYGSRLCAGDMLKQEEELRTKIKELKANGTTAI